MSKVFDFNLYCIIVEIKNCVVIQGGPKRRPQLTAVIGNFNDIIDKMSLTFISFGEKFFFF